MIAFEAIHRKPKKSRLMSTLNCGLSGVFPKSPLGIPTAFLAIFVSIVVELEKGKGDIVEYEKMSLDGYRGSVR